MNYLIILFIIYFIWRISRSVKVSGNPLQGHGTIITDPFLVQKNLKRDLKIILKSFDYYNQIDERNKKRFEKRVRSFIRTRRFIVRTQGMTLTNEMIVLISASAVQISFGFPRINFKHFYRILIYADTYYSTITHQYHKGEVNRAGIIVLSWKSFAEGYLNSGDGRNLGLHEMAHALMIENSIMNGEVDFLHRQDLEAWHKKAAVEMPKIKAGDSIFRAYSATNEQELFASAVEVYFEQPLKLKEYDPAWYEVMCRLLNQDILQLTGRN